MVFIIDRDGCTIARGITTGMSQKNVSGLSKRTLVRFIETSSMLVQYYLNLNFLIIIYFLKNSV